MARIKTKVWLFAQYLYAR